MKWRERSAGDDPLRRVALAGVVLVLAATGHRVIGMAADPGAGHVLRTALDDRIPFLPWTVFLYSWVYTSMLLPLFVVRNDRLFERVAAAYLAVVGVSLATFLTFPVTALGFRPDELAFTLDPERFVNWGVQLTFYIDPPTNLFPSLHVSIATISMLATGKARRAFGLAALPVMVAIVITISTMKQHYVADGIAGILLATGVYWIVIRPWEPEPDAGPVAYGWRGPALYLALHCTFYGVFYGLFLAGYRPWEG